MKMTNMVARTLTPNMLINKMGQITVGKIGQITVGKIGQKL